MINYEVRRSFRASGGTTPVTSLTPDLQKHAGKFETFKNTKAIVFDMRGYPRGTAWSIEPRLTDRRDLPVALFRRPEVLRPNIPAGEILDSHSGTEFIQTIAPSGKWKYQVNL